MLLASGIALLSTTACNGSYPIDSIFEGSSKNAANENENIPPEPEKSTSEALVFPLALSQDMVPNTPTLALSVQTDNDNVSQPISAQYDEATNTWIANVTAHTGKSREFILTWSEMVGDQPLKLAQTTKSVAITPNIKQLNLDIPIDEYNLSFDADADGMSNLTEINNSTNPFNSSDPGTFSIDPGVSSVKVESITPESLTVEVNVHLFIPGELTDIQKNITVTPSFFLNGSELTMSFDPDVAEFNEPVSDADFDKVLGRFDALSRAIESKDTDALDRLATSSQQSDLFKRLMNDDYDRIEVSIDNIRLRNIDKSVTGTLQIDYLLRPNGDRGLLSEKYASHTISSRRVKGAWSKIQW